MFRIGAVQDAANRAQIDAIVAADADAAKTYVNKFASFF
jgi:hypothetical protein